MLHSWTRIHSNSRDYTIGDFVRNKIVDNVSTYNVKSGKFEQQQAVSHINAGLTTKENFIKIYFQTPSHRTYQKIVCTLDQKLLTKSGIRQAKDITVEDSFVGFYENPLNDIEEQILLGSLLGDGYLHKSTLKASLRLENSEQTSYLKWKVKQLSSLSFNQNQKHPDKFDSEYNFFLKRYYDMFYENEVSLELKNKTGRLYRAFSPEIFEKLDFLGLVILYLDDGSLIDNRVYIGSKRFRHLEKCTFFDHLLKSFERFGLKGSKLNNGYSILLSEKSSFAFSNLIRQLVIPQMQYKLIAHDRSFYNENLFAKNLFKTRQEKIFVNVIRVLPIKKEVLTLRMFNIETLNKTYLIGSAKDFSGIVSYNK